MNLSKNIPCTCLCPYVHIHSPCPLFYMNEKVKSIRLALCIMHLRRNIRTLSVFEHILISIKYCIKFQYLKVNILPIINRLSIFRLKYLLWWFNDHLYRNICECVQTVMQDGVLEVYAGELLQKCPQQAMEKDRDGTFTSLQHMLGHQIYFIFARDLKTLHLFFFFKLHSQLVDWAIFSYISKPFH